MIRAAARAAAQSLDDALKEVARGLGPHAQDPSQPARTPRALRSERRDRVADRFAGLGPLVAGLRARAQVVRPGPHRARGHAVRRHARLDDQRRARVHERRADHDLRLPFVQARRAREACATRSAPTLHRGVRRRRSSRCAASAGPTRTFDGFEAPDARRADRAASTSIRVHQAIEAIVDVLDKARSVRRTLSAVARWQHGARLDVTSRTLGWCACCAACGAIN